MSVEQKLDRIIERQAEHGILLASIETDLRHHIKRSDQHEVQLKTQENKINKLWMAISALVGAGASSVGPAILKFLGSIL